MYDTELEGNRLNDLPIKIYRFLLKSIGYLKKMTRDVNLFFIIFTYFGTSHNFDK